MDVQWTLSFWSVSGPSVSEKRYEQTQNDAKRRFADSEQSTYETASILPKNAHSLSLLLGI